MASIETLSALIDEGFRLSVHCENPFCRRYVDLDISALAETLGRDFVFVGKPNPLTARMRCSKCGGKELGLILIPTTPYDRVVSHGPTHGPVPADWTPAVRRARRKVRL